MRIKISSSLISVKHMFIDEVEKNTNIVNDGKGIYRNWHQAKNLTRILDKLIIIERGKKRYITIKEKKIIIQICLNENLIEIIEIKNKKILKLTNEGFKYANKKKFEINRYIEKILGL